MNAIWRALIAAILMIVSVRASSQDTLSRLRETGVITIAHRESSVPFSYLDDQGHPVGYAIDLCLDIVEGIRRALKLPRLDVEYLPVTPSNRIPVIVSGKADLECGSTTNTRERRKQVAFTISHFISSARMIVRTNSKIHNWPDLRGKTVVTTRGTTNAKTLRERSSVLSLNIHLVESRDHAQGFAMVANGKADAFAMDDVLLFGLRANAGKPSDFRVVGDSLSAEPYAIMLRNDDQAFKALVDGEMARIINDGEIYRLYDKWFMHPIPPHGINMNMPMGMLLRESLRFPGDFVGEL